MVRNSSPFLARPGRALPTSATEYVSQHVYEPDMNVAEPFDRESALGGMIRESPDADDVLAKADSQERRRRWRCGVETAGDVSR